MSLVRRVAAVVALFASSAPALALAREAQPPRPKLVVLVVMDQFREDYLDRFADLFDAKHGAFTRFRERGAFYPQAFYRYATTYTGTGHGLVVTGGYANQTGLVGNLWWDRDLHRIVGIAYDPDHHLLEPGDDYDGTSPRHLLGSTVFDELVLNSQGRSKVVSVSLKARSAVMLAGKLGKAYWFSTKTGGFDSSDYYFPVLPPWVRGWNAKKLPDAYFGATWTPFVPESAFARASADDAPGEGDVYGLGKTFPHKITGGKDKPGEDFYEALIRTPMSTEMELDFAKNAVEEEHLGEGDATDVLAISLSANDEAGHVFGPYSREIVDVTARTDRLLGAFLRWLDDARPGAVVLLTADHGATPIPEYTQSLGIESHRITRKDMKDALQKALTARFGEGDWVEAMLDPSVYLNEKLIAEKKLDPAAVEDVAARALETVPGISRCWTRTQLLHGQAGPTELDQAQAVVFHPQRSGDVLVLTTPYAFWGKYADAGYGDGHGSPYAYDTHVPLALYGPGIPNGVVSTKVSMTDVAPTLAWILHVNPPPAATEGEVLPLPR